MTGCAGACLDTADTPFIEPPFPVEPAGGVERACMWVPVIGWVVAAGLEARRRRARNVFIAKQIAGRRHSTIEAWGNDPRRQAVAATVCKAIQTVLGWPNSHYLPDD